MYEYHHLAAINEHPFILLFIYFIPLLPESRTRLHHENITSSLLTSSQEEANERTEKDRWNHHVKEKESGRAE
jgi:hypothetical protein